MQNIWSVVDLWHPNPLWWCTIIPFVYGVSLDSRMLDKILYIVDRHECLCNYYILFIALFINRYSDRLLPFLRQFLLIPSRISERILLPPVLIISAGIWSVPGDLYLFSFSIAISSSKALDSGPCGSAVCISVCVTSLTPCTLKS